MNIKNIANLIKAYFIENWKTDLFQFGILAAVILFGNITHGSGSNLNFPLFVSCIFLMIYPERLFRNLHNNSQKIHYLSIPASNGEKVVTNMLLTNIYYVFGLVAASAIGLALGHLYLTMRGYEGVHLCTFVNARWVLSLYAALAIFFFGSIYFRRRTTLSTLGVGMLIAVVFTTLISLTIWVNGITLIPKDAAFRDFVWSWNYSSADTLSNWVSYLFLSAVIIYFYALSFLRLKETEA